MDADGYPIEDEADAPVGFRYVHGSEEDAGDVEFQPLRDASVLAINRIRRFQEIGGNCDSPIEYTMGAALLVYFERAGYLLSLCKTIDLDSALDADKLLLVPQFAWSFYRSDWALYNPKTKMALLIECDGKDFHSSKDQVEHDRKKDAAALLRGHLTMRFTGSQIHRDADGCAQRVFDAVYA
ncbi:hypothetical protein AB8A05_04090 [Tardiphaga sp. 538_B7_N1_4]|uniref:hypothetical protein n=1 Tax=Tardiphaga sp. 538_B7_N1_4 TaxID=3240778 RepID=UPI003F20BFB3